MAWAISLTYMGTLFTGIHKWKQSGSEIIKEKQGYIGWICGRPCQFVGFIIVYSFGMCGLWEPKVVEEPGAFDCKFDLYPYFISIFLPCIGHVIISAPYTMYIPLFFSYYGILLQVLDKFLLASFRSGLGS